jgi:HEAT repeat protein
MDLGQRLRATDPRTRLDALLEIMGLEAPAAQPELMRLVIAHLDDPHPGLRQAALDTLGRLSALRGLEVEPAVVERALALADDPSVKVRAEAAGALGLLTCATLVPGRQRTLLRLLEDSAPEVRQEAAAALGDLGEASAIEPLARRLDDADPDVSFEAAFALATLRDPRARPRLEAELQRARRRLDASEALARLGDPAAIPALRRAASRWLLGWADRLSLWGTAHALGDPDAGEHVLARVSARRREERLYALSLIGSRRITAGANRLLAIVRDPEDPLREAAIQALGALGERAHTPVLSALAGAPDEPLAARLEAIAALGALGGDEARMALARLSEDADRDIREAAQAAAAGREDPGK